MKKAFAADKQNEVTTMTRKEILEIIRGGGSVLVKGRHITTEEEIDAALSASMTDKEKEAEISRLEAQLADLKKAGKSKAQSATALPDDFPSAKVFSKLGLNSVKEIQSKSREELVALDGIGEKMADAAIAYGK